MARLTTHVLDLVAGGGAAGMTVELFALEESGATRRIATRVTDGTGRTDAPFLDGEAMRVGRYQFVFHVGDYFAARGVALPTPRFIDRVPVRFAIASPDENCHVPLAVAPSGYSAYRGS